MKLIFLYLFGISINRKGDDNEEYVEPEWVKPTIYIRGFMRLSTPSLIDVSKHPKI
jgi:hypothetical protein